MFRASIGKYVLLIDSKMRVDTSNSVFDTFNLCLHYTLYVYYYPLLKTETLIFRQATRSSYCETPHTTSPLLSSQQQAQ
jgi:hypothetical protein